MLLLLLALAGCGSDRLACGRTIDEYQCGAPPDYSGQFPPYALCNFSDYDGHKLCTGGNFIRGCGGYDVVAWVNVDTGMAAYYDSSTGALVAITSGSSPQGNCWAGPAAGFTPPNCSIEWAPLCDGGAP